MGFRDINRYPAMKAKYEAYKAWQDLSPDKKQDLYATVAPVNQRLKPERKPAAVAPFNITGTNLVYVKANVLTLDQSGVTTGIDLAKSCAELCSDYIKPLNSAGINVVQLTGKSSYKFARLTLTTVTPATSRTPSRITKTQYYKPSVNSATCPFGQKTAGQDYDTVVAEISAKPKFVTHAEGNNSRNRYKFTPEGA
jgi:hypothetical protein